MYSIGGAMITSTSAAMLAAPSFTVVTTPFVCRSFASSLALSAAVGTGCGAFVGTDVSFGAANWLAPVVGIQEKFGAARACVAAGLSTSIGFMANMVVQAAALPAKACWIDADYANPRAA